MARVPLLRKDQADPVLQPAYDRMASGGGSVMHAFRALAHGPVLAGVWMALGRYVRFDSPLPQPVVEIAALVASHELDGPYMWARHVPDARRQGVSEATLSAIRDDGPDDGLPEDEARYVRYARELLRGHRVSDATYAAAHAKLGDAGCVELTALVCFMAAFTLFESTLDIEVEPGVAPLGLTQS